MSGYRIGSVHYKDFGPFQDEVFDFGQPGLTLIEAVIEGKRGCDSNGAGKSFLYDGVAWALYGRCIRPDYTGDDLIRGKWDPKRKRNIPAPGTWASVRVELIGGPRPITIERYRKHSVHSNRVRLLVSGKDISRGTNAETSRAIENLIGMDFTTFCNSVAFGVREDVKSFFAASDADRKRIMDTLLGLELYAAAEVIARGRTKKIGAQLAEFSERRTELTAALAEKRLLLQNLESSPGMEDTDFQIKILNALLRRLDRARQQSKQDIKTLEDDLRAEEDRYEKAMKEHATQARIYERARADLERKRRGLERDVGTFEGEARQIETRMRRLVDLAGGVCPTCDQPFSGEKADEAGRQLQDQLDEVRHKINAVMLEQDICKAQLDNLEDPEPPESLEVDTVKEEIAQERERRAEILKHIEVEEVRREEMQEAQARFTAQTSRLEQEIESTIEKVRVLEKDCDEIETQAKMLEFWTEAFGSQGIRSFLIEAELPEINRWSTVYAQRLLGAGVRVRLSPTTKLKTKDVSREKISIEAVIPGCTNSYAGASVGQKKRLNLCLLLAFRRVLADRSSKAFRQLFADELFDGLDKTGAESVAGLLREISEDCPVTLVTHDSRIKSVADRVITVHHNGVYARLIGQGRAPRASAKPPTKKKVARRA